MNTKLLRQNSLSNALMFFCPGCQCGHMVTVNGERNPKGFTWGWNGDLEKPTFSPSVLMEHNGEPPMRCHSEVRDGMIQFLADCTHKLAGQTVPLPEWKDV